MEELVVEAPIDYVIHCASTTTSSYMVSNPVETADGIVKDIGRPRKEEELGEISLQLPRSCYPMAKHMAEHYCHIYFTENQVPVKIARLAQTFGRGVSDKDTRVFMQFIKSVIEQKDIVLKTEGKSIGNYCDSLDAVKAIFSILNYGKNGEVYNVVNEKNTMCIRDMANLVADKIANGKIKVVYEKTDKIVYAPDTELRLSSEKLRGLGWEPTKDLEEMYKDMMEDLYN